MKMPLWEIFNVPFCSDENVALVGLDLGAGNCSAAIVDVTAQTHTSPLSFDSDKQVKNIYTAISYNSENAFLGLEASRDEQGIKGPFANFKRPPGTGAMAYFDGNPHNPTYEELMRRFFQAIVQRLFDKEKRLGEANHVILFVGRPASPLWMQNATQYQQLLTQNMKIRGYSGKIDVMICSEAQAALAYEYSYKNIQKNEIVLIVDCGSSTFDAVLVCNRAIIGEYSRQLGAGQIEQLMYAQILAQGDEVVLQDISSRERMVREKSQRLVGMRKGDHILKLRERKEQFFGSEGTNGDRQDLRYGRIRLEGAGKLAQDIDEEFMDNVLNTLPVMVPFAQNGMNVEYPSFVAASRDFLVKTQEAVCDNHGVTVDRVILTGGSSVMPFITEQVKEIFGLGTVDNNAVSRTPEPAFSVGKGLAFMGHVEYLKMYVLENCEKLIRRELDASEEELHRIFTDVYANFGLERLLSNLQIWKSSNRYGDTFPEGVRGDNFDPPTDAIRQQIQNHISSLKDANGKTLEERMKEIIDGSIKQLFDYSSDFSMKVSPQDVAAVIEPVEGEPHPLREIKFTVGTLLGGFAKGQNIHAALSYSQREEFYAAVEHRRTEIRKALLQQFTAKTIEPKNQLKEKIAERTMEDLSNYLEEITPFVVEQIQTGNQITHTATAKKSGGFI